MKFIYLLIIGLFCFQSAISKEIELKKFGGEIKGEPALMLNQVINDFAQHKNKTVIMEAQAEKVCEQKGCWMVLTDGKNSIRTLFKDYGFFVPKNILNKKVKVQGIMEQKSVSIATQKHYLKDAGASADDIKKVTASKMEFQFTADAVEIL